MAEVPAGLVQLTRAPAAPLAGAAGAARPGERRSAMRPVLRAALRLPLLGKLVGANVLVLAAAFAVLALNGGVAQHGFTLNGKSFPATEPIVAKLGQKVRIRYMNEGMMIHPMHLHGMHQTVIAKDGWPQPQPWKCDTLNIAPGERWDVIVKCNNPGTWAFHCHILPHAESDHGMFGMVTALIVQK